MISVQNLSVRAGSFKLENVSLEIPTGEYGVLMGKTGSGKTTILEAICGLKSVMGGTICLMDRDVTQLKPMFRGIGYVPQDGALFSKMTVRQHLAFAPMLRKWKAAAVDERVHELADLLGIEHLLERTPQGLSGGEAQRVALGRALSSHPSILCLDEPLSALDSDTKQEMYVLLKSVREHYNVTTLHITHSPDEARHLADCVFFIRDGQIHRVDVREME